MIALLLLWLPPVQAVQVQARDVPCPLGGGTVRVYDKVSANTAGGFDSDLAGYASGGGQWRAYAIATCNDNLLTLYGVDMGSVPDADISRLATALAQASQRVADPKAPAVWERYRVAEALYAALGRDSVFLGDLVLEASWTARDAAVGFYPGIRGPSAARALLDAGWEELKKPLALGDRKKVLYNLARVAHRGGWGSERDASLAAFEAVEPMTPPEREAVARFRRLAGEVEPALQDAAILHYTAALRTELAHDEKVRVTYVLGDLLRRRGRDREAAQMYLLVSNDKEASEELRGMAMFLLTPIVERLDPVPAPRPASGVPAR